MTPYRHFTKSTSWPHRLRRGGLYLAVAAVLATHSAGCGSGDNGSDWEEVKVQEVTKGVVTTLQETESGQYTIIDEKVVAGRDASRVIIRKLDGQVDTLNLEQAKGLVGATDTVYQQVRSNHHHGMGSVLWWGAMGYLMGRNLGTPAYPGIYRSGAAPAATVDELRRTSVTRTEMRPIKGRSGFFRNSGRGSSTS